MQKRVRFKKAINILLCLLMLSIGMTLTGCGLDGPLYLPDKDHPEEQPDPNKPSWF